MHNSNLEKWKMRHHNLPYYAQEYEILYADRSRMVHEIPFLRQQLQHISTKWRRCYVPLVMYHLCYVPPTLRTTYVVYHLCYIQFMYYLCYVPLMLCTTYVRYQLYYVSPMLCTTYVVHHLLGTTYVMYHLCYVPPMLCTTYVRCHLR